MNSKAVFERNGKKTQNFKRYKRHEEPRFIEIIGTAKKAVSLKIHLKKDKFFLTLLF